MTELERIYWNCPRCDRKMLADYRGYHEHQHIMDNMDDQRIQKQETLSQLAKVLSENDRLCKLQATLLERNGSLWAMIAELLGHWCFIDQDDFMRCIHCNGAPQAEWWSDRAKDPKRIVHSPDCSFVRIFRTYEHAMIGIQVSKDPQRGTNDDGCEDVRPVRGDVLDAGEPGPPLGAEA